MTSFVLPGRCREIGFLWRSDRRRLPSGSAARRLSPYCKRVNYQCCKKTDQRRQPRCPNNFSDSISFHSRTVSKRAKRFQSRKPTGPRRPLYTREARSSQLYFLAMTSTTAWAAFSTSGVRTSSPSDLAFALAVLASPGLAALVDSSLYSSVSSSLDLIEPEISAAVYTPVTATERAAASPALRPPGRRPMAEPATFPKAFSNRPPPPFYCVSEA